MNSQKTIFRNPKFRKIVPVLLLSCVTLAGCSEDNAHSAKPKQKKQETVGNHNFAKLEDKFDAKLGVYAIDTGTGRTVTYHPNKRFGYASTYKSLAAGALLKQNSIDKLNKKITYSKDDLVTYSPITKKHVDSGMTLKQIGEAAVRKSDNTAGNLLLKQLGGPDGFKKALKGIGDNMTQPERVETDLNEVAPGDTHDTSTPKTLAADLKAFTVGDVLPADKRKILTNWLKGNPTGDSLIRAGVPKGWVVGDKSGAGSYGIRNDIAIIWPPKGDPIVLAILSHRDKKDADYNDKLIAQAAKEAIDILEDNQK